ncbi:MAG: NAD(P)/FAD-dependent oxidoreductase [Clostridia bacterium]|nr:NAD(P)/FAD-dependent oxidoreductase [Clostridia bacterium]MBQ7047240.1 NAD(P)/FAD-dependent oxidoreductase [Oscillospiraceae bacterium]
MSYDVAIIGAGVTGAMIARELSRYNIKTALIERCSDMAMGTTKANSAIVHAGFDAVPGTLKAKLNVEGTSIMPELCSVLHVPFKPIGSYVVAFSKDEIEHLEKLKARGEENGVPGLRILNSDELHKEEPNLNEKAVAALFAPTAGIVCPYELTIATVENAVTNGVEFIRNFNVIAIDKNADGNFVLKSEDKTIEAEYVINAAGSFCDQVASLIGDDSITIIPRKGEYMLMDRAVGNKVSHVIFQCPSKMGKGILVTPTVDGNLLIGPSAIDIEEKDDCATTADGLDGVFKTALKSVPSLTTREIITSFAGIRAHSPTDDFIIESSSKDDKFINVAGIESPGLSSAPAIGVYVCNMVIEAMGGAEKNVDFVPGRPAPVRFREMNTEERKALIEKNNAYGRIICRCETITEGEIIDAIHAPAGAIDVDGVKRRTRAGMGRCQGGFCGSKVVEILARELGQELDEITKCGGESKILFGRTK